MPQQFSKRDTDKKQSALMPIIGLFTAIALLGLSYGVATILLDLEQVQAILPQLPPDAPEWSFQAGITGILFLVSFGFAMVLMSALAGSSAHPKYYVDPKQSREWTQQKRIESRKKKTRRR